MLTGLAGTHGDSDSEMVEPVSSGRSRASLSAVARAWASLLALWCTLALGAIAHAEPWAAPGDLSLRDDLQLLADLGIIRAPLTSWPVPWAQIAEATLETPLDVTLRPYERAVLTRVQRRVREATRSGAVRSLRVSAQELPRRVRTFEYSPREEGELQGGWSWLGNRFAANLTTTAVTSPEDDQTVRFDGSYGAVVLGNWMLSVGQFDRWWGPGWNGSLIFSNNARPVPAVSLDRNY
ncbi:MAG: capsule assembly Wzi family protein, partial [Pseudomonadota bacterium]